MKRTEAIEWLEVMKETAIFEQYEALKMAIEALLSCNELVYCWECKHKDKCPQTILLDANNKIINFCSYGERKGGDS